MAVDASSGEPVLRGIRHLPPPVVRVKTTLAEKANKMDFDSADLVQVADIVYTYFGPKIIASEYVCRLYEIFEISYLFYDNMRNLRKYSKRFYIPFSISPRLKVLRQQTSTFRPIRRRNLYLINFNFRIKHKLNKVWNFNLLVLGFSWWKSWGRCLENSLCFGNYCKGTMTILAISTV